MFSRFQNALMLLINLIHGLFLADYFESYFRKMHKVCQNIN